MWTYNHPRNGNHVDVTRAQVSFETARLGDRGNVFMARRLFTDVVFQVFLHVHWLAERRPGEIF